MSELMQKNRLPVEEKCETSSCGRKRSQKCRLMSHIPPCVSRLIPAPASRSPLKARSRPPAQIGHRKEVPQRIYWLGPLGVPNPSHAGQSWLPRNLGGAPSGWRCEGPVPASDHPARADILIAAPLSGAVLVRPCVRLHLCDLPCETYHGAISRTDCWPWCVPLRHHVGGGG